MTKEELNEHIKELDATIGLGIHTNIVKAWLEDIRDNGIKEEVDMNLDCKVQLGKYAGKPFYVKWCTDNWAFGESEDIEVHGTRDESNAWISKRTAEELAELFSKAKVVKPND